MKKYIIIAAALAVAALAYFLIPTLTKSGKILMQETDGRMLPRVLFLTTGLNEGNGELSEGVTIALQSFCKRGAVVRLENRDILFQPDKLAAYSIMIIPTSMGYHDGDRKYSLTFMSEVEMQNISDWVSRGGTLVAEENIGRNTLEESDRADINGELNPKTWKLSELFGIKMRERDMNGFSIEEKDGAIWKGRIKEPLGENEWVLIPTELISDSIKVMAEWVNGSEKIPAIIRNKFGSGYAYLLTSTYLLHPSNDGGVSGVEQIENFYDYVLDFNAGTERICELNPWPNAFSSAFCISFNSGGKSERLKILSDFLTKEKLRATFFVDSAVTADELKILQDNKNISPESNFFSKKDFSQASFSEVTRQFLLNEEKFGIKFEGVRFPFYSTNFWGLLYADEKGYRFDSSIGVDHLINYAGSVFPYNIPVSKDSYYKTLNLLELCPIKNDDVVYFAATEKGSEYTDDLQRKDAQLFEKYLSDFYEYAAHVNRGLMIYQGDPQITAFSEITLQPLKQLSDSLKTRNCWMTTLEDVTAFRNKIRDLTVISTPSQSRTKLKIGLPAQDTIRGLTFRLNPKPESVETAIKYEIREINGSYFLTADVMNGDELVLNYR